jgi:Rrf2 family protein
MHITTKTRYALRAILDIARHQGDLGLPVRRIDIGTRERFSRDYLEQILGKLRDAGYVETIRGPRGGYRLKKDPSEISLWDILSVVENKMDLPPCLDGGRNTCKRTDHCDAAGVWRFVAKATREQFQKITIAQILAGKFNEPG